MPIFSKENRGAVDRWFRPIRTTSIACADRRRQRKLCPPHVSTSPQTRTTRAND